MKVNEKLIYKNREGKIVKITDRFGGYVYKLFDSKGNYVKDIPPVFRVADYL